MNFCSEWWLVLCFGCLFFYILYYGHFFGFELVFGVSIGEETKRDLDFVSDI